MSRRGGGGGRGVGGGRGPDSRRDQPSPSFQRGGRGGGRGEGRGYGGGRGRGRGSGYAAGPPPSAATPSAATPPAVAPILPQAATASSSSVPPAYSSQGASTSAAAAGIAGDVEKRLTLSGPSPPALPPASSKAVRFPARPGYGTLGKKCVVRANHFLVQVADRDLHHYDVSITPEVTSKKVTRDIMKKLVSSYCESHLGKRMPAYDGRKCLYSAGPFPFASKEFVVKLDETVGQPGSSTGTVRRKEREFKVTIKFAAKVDLYPLQQFLRSRQMDAPQETIQLLDVVLRASPSESYTVVGRSFFSPDLGPMGELGDGIEYWRGYYQSLRPTQLGLSLNIDVSARAFYEPICVTEFIVKYLNLRDISRPLSDQDRVKVKKSLRGVKVQIDNGKYIKSCKITGVSSQPASQLMFTLDDRKTQISVAQYFREKHGIMLKYSSLPALQAGSESKPVYLPMELCNIVEGQRYSRKLNERQVTALLRATCQRPRDREASVRKMVKQNNFNMDELVNKEFGIQVRDELTLIDARVLPPPQVKYHASGREASVNPWLGSWNMINKKMFDGGRVEFWTCVSFSLRSRRELPFQFCEQLIEMCNSKGMVFNPKPIIPILQAQPNQIEKTLVDVHNQSTAKLESMGMKGKHLQLLIVILPDASGSYGKIKRVCETELGIVSQCCQPRQAAKLNKQYFENVALKINVKVGGRNSVLNDAIQRRIHLLTDVPTIIFGADVTHPQPGEDSSPSIAAVVASMDWPEVTKYRGIVSAQHHREEMIEDLYTKTEDPQRGIVHGGMIRELLIAFRRSTGHKPHRIIFYRDGVSEGQFSQVLLYEMSAIREACQSLEAGYLPPVTFVVVQKRHHTRLFPADHGSRDQTDKSGNILPGTVVDTHICHPTEFDFYLNSHAGIQGTSRPTHYHVLFDENRFNADTLQVLTNNLCYTYARCTRSVSIVPPAYYAHLAAFRARYYIEGDTSDTGSSSGGRSTMERTTTVRPLPVIKENVKNVMFYC